LEDLAIAVNNLFIDSYQFDYTASIKEKYSAKIITKVVFFLGISFRGLSVEPEC